MRILISRLTTEIGGAELSAKDHALVLSQMDHSVTFVSNNDSLLKRVVRKNISTRSMFWEHTKTLRPLLFPILGIFNIIIAFWISLTNRPRIVNPHSRDDQIIFTLLKPLFRYRVVWKDAGDMHFMLRSFRPKLIARLYQRLYMYCIKKADGIYFLNSDNESEALSFVPQLQGKTKVIPSDVLFEELNPTLKSKKKNLIIGTVIRLVEDKGVDLLIQAFAHIHKSHPNTELWVVGDGALRSDLEKLTQRLDVDGSVTFAGNQSDPSYWYSNFDIFVQPAIYEPWGRTIKEAKYFGLPVIGSATSGISKQIVDGETGMLFKPGNIKGLETKLNSLLTSDSLRKSLGEAGKKSVLKEGDFHTKIKREILPFLEGIS